MAIDCPMRTAILEFYNGTWSNKRRHWADTGISGMRFVRNSKIIQKNLKNKKLKIESYKLLSDFEFELDNNKKN
jgi:hypothetical protein